MKWCFHGLSLVTHDLGKEICNFRDFSRTANNLRAIEVDVEEGKDK